jgi:hypothetical protein
MSDIYPVETLWITGYPEVIFARGDFKLPPPYPNMVQRDFPWAPQVSYKELRSRRSYPQFFTGSYGTSGSWDGNEWVPKETRHHGTQHYTNGDKFTGSFRNLGGAPSEGTYYFANGNTLKGIFRDWQRGTQTTCVDTGEAEADAWDGCTRSIILKQPNSISSGIFYNKTHGLSYTGQWTTSPTGETTLSGYILVEDIHGHPFIVYYRDGHPYEDFNKWFKITKQQQCQCCGCKSAAPGPRQVCSRQAWYAAWDVRNPDEILMSDPLLHPDSREGLWTTNFKKRIYAVWEADAEAETAAGIGIV